jgi:hypothetical protein
MGSVFLTPHIKVIYHLQASQKIVGTWFEIQIWICVQDGCDTEKWIQNSAYIQLLSFRA